MQKPTLTIDLSALRANYRLIKAESAASIAAVVKANAYSLGAEPVVKALMEEGCTQYFVATPDEGATIRAIAEDAQIMVLGGLYREGEDFYLDHHLIPVINSLEELQRWRDFSEKESFALPYWLHVNTGMNRLGLGEEELAQYLDDPEQYEPLHLMGLMSHFCSSEDKNSALNQQQADLFAKIAREFPDVPKSLCNSAGIFQSKSWHYDVLRPGYALYGGNPTPGSQNPMQPVVRLDAPVLQVRHVKKGETIGYNATHTFPENTHTATLPLGYADGFHRAGSNKASVYYKGQACPVLGRVSMDLISVGIGHLADKPAPGDRMEILGPHQDIEALAADMGTIGYEILTSLGTRYHREYLS